jgi:hypothetical protein
VNITQYVKRNHITVEVVRDRGTQADKQGWEHHAYVLKLVWNDGALSRTMTDVPWMQGLGIAESPTDRPDAVLDALVSDAASYLDARSFEDWCDELGYDHDSRTAERTYLACGEIAKKLTEFVGGSAELNRLAYHIDRL